MLKRIRSNVEANRELVHAVDVGVVVERLREVKPAPGCQMTHSVGIANEASLRTYIS